jgi:L-2-hydroxyglutarate oxidase LhgO
MESRVIPAKLVLRESGGGRESNSFAIDVVPRFRGGDDNFPWFGGTERPIITRLKARANRAKSGSANFSCRLSRRTAIKKAERKRRRSPVPDGTGRSFDPSADGR